MPAEADLAVAAAAAAPALAFAGSWLGVRANRRGALELDRWRRREETMRLMRWAAELDDPVAEYDQDAAAGDDDDVAYTDEPWAPDVDR